MTVATYETHCAGTFDMATLEVGSLESGRIDLGFDASSQPEIEGYRLLRQIGSGGMGVVYLAMNIAIGRRCAIKIIRADRADEQGIDRFRSEGELLRQLSHPAIVQVIDSGETDEGLPYFAMDYIAGRNLEDAVREDGPLSSRQVVSVVRQVCQALAEVHAEGLVHRDIKPANLLEGCDRLCQAVTLIDFGLAESIASEWCETESDACFVGSPLYSPPEASCGSFDQRSDIYSLGATAYHLLTGRPVFDAHHPVAAIAAHAAHEPVSLRSLDASVSPALNAIVMKCLSKRPEDRYQSVEELEAALATVN